MAIKINSKTTGPFWDNGTKEVRVANHEWVADMLREGEAKVESQLTPGHGVLTGEYKSSIATEHKYHNFGIIDDSDDWKLAIRGVWLEGVADLNQATRFKGYAMWKKSTAHLRKLTRQVAGKVYKRMAQRLT